MCPQPGHFAICSALSCNEPNRVDLTQSLTSAGGRVGNTKQTTVVLIVVVVVLIVGAAAAGVLLSSSSHSTTSTQTSSQVVSTSSQSLASSGAQDVGPFMVTSNQLLVGYQSGSWQMQFQYVGQEPISTMIVTLKSPTPTIICTGFNGGLQFANCIGGAGGAIIATPDPGGNFNTGHVFNGFATGAGPGSAVGGTTYDFELAATFANQTTTTYTGTVVAQAIA